MKATGYLRRVLYGLVLAFCAMSGISSPPAAAENIRILHQGTSRALHVQVNRAVVVESEVPFAELSIANPDIADISTLSNHTIYVLGKSSGITTLTLLDLSGRLIANVDVHVAADVSEFKERLRQILPDEKIEVRTANDGIVLSGVVSSGIRLQRALDLAERYAPGRVSNLMSVGGIQQVMLKVRFAEMQRSVSKSLSSSLALGGSNGSGNLAVSGGSGSTISSGSISTALNGAVPVVNSNTGAILFGFNVGATQVGLLLEALEKKGVVRTLAEPNLVALSGQQAKFLAGGEFPIPAKQNGGSVGIEFKAFGVELTFVPRVVDKSVINLAFNAAVSAVDSENSLVLNGFNIPAFSRRETSTTVELRDGDSFAVAGLLTDDFKDKNSQLPWIGDVPVLGTLFRSAEYQRAQTELVIIITAHLVTPKKGHTVALPTDRVKPPSEKDLFLNGRTASGGGLPGTGAAAEVAKQDFSGSYGYVLD